MINSSEYTQFPDLKVHEEMLSEKAFRLKFLSNLCPYFTKYGGCNNMHNESVPSLCTKMKCPHAFCINCVDNGCNLCKGKLDTCRDWRVD